MGRRSSRGGCGVGGLGGIGGGGAGGAAHHWRQTRSASPRDGAAAVRRGGEGVRASGGAEGRGKAGGSSAAATATARPLAGGPWRGGRASGCNTVFGNFLLGVAVRGGGQAEVTNTREHRRLKDGASEGGDGPCGHRFYLAGSGGCRGAWRSAGGRGGGASGRGAPAKDAVRSPDPGRTPQRGSR